MSFGPDTHPTPLWDHPDYEFVGWADRLQMSRGNLLAVNPGPSDEPYGYVPAFRAKNGRGTFAVEHIPDVGTDITHFPDDGSLNPTRWSVDESASIGSKSDNHLNARVMSSTPHERGGFTWSMGHRAGKSHPGVIREVARVIDAHHPGVPIQARRTTGATAGKPNAFRRFDISKATADDIERFYLEVYG